MDRRFRVPGNPADSRCRSSNSACSARAVTSVSSFLSLVRAFRATSSFSCSRFTWTCLTWAMRMKCSAVVFQESFERVDSAIRSRSVATSSVSVATCASSSRSRRVVGSVGCWATRTASLWRRNVEALQQVQPTKLLPGEITARLGAPWIPAPVITGFARELFDRRAKVHHAGGAEWVVDGGARTQRAGARSGRGLSAVSFPVSPGRR